MGVRLRRNLGAVSHLSAGEYTTETRDEQPEVCCPRCGRFSALDMSTHEVFRDGTVSMRWACPGEGCAFIDFLFLEAWLEPVVPAPRVETAT